jgi:hypothetical protein
MDSFIGQYLSSLERASSDAFYKEKSPSTFLQVKMEDDAADLIIAPIDLSRATSEDLLMIRPLMCFEPDPLVEHQSIKDVDLFKPFPLPRLEAVSSSCSVNSFGYHQEMEAANWHPYNQKIRVLEDLGSPVLNENQCLDEPPMDEEYWEPTHFEAMEQHSSIPSSCNSKPSCTPDTNRSSSYKSMESTHVPVSSQKKERKPHCPVICKAKKPSPKAARKTPAERKTPRGKVLSSKSGLSSSVPAVGGPRFRHYQAENWSLRFREVKHFVEGHGHCVIPHDYPSNQVLSRWAKRQRYQYKLYEAGSKKSSMTVERIEALEELGFCWDAHKSLWTDRFEELKKFVKEHGHADVPTAYRNNRQLATWVKCQRRQYKLRSAGVRANINSDRVKLLESAGFKWAVERK